jgi:hypothetical protein
MKVYNVEYNGDSNMEVSIDVSHRSKLTSDNVPDILRHLVDHVCFVGIEYVACMYVSSKKEHSIMLPASPTTIREAPRRVALV